MKGGLRMVILFSVADGFDAGCAASVETDAIAGT